MHHHGHEARAEREEADVPTALSGEVQKEKLKFSRIVDDTKKTLERLIVNTANDTENFNFETIKLLFDQMEKTEEGQQ